MSWCMFLSPMLSLIRPLGSLPSVVSPRPRPSPVCLWPLSLSSLLSSCAPKSAPQSLLCQVHRGSILQDTRPLTSSWGTLPGDLTTLRFAPAEEGPFVPGLVCLARSSHPNPANYRPPCGRAARSPTAFPRPRRKPLSAEREQRVIQRPPARCGPAGPMPPLSARLLRSRPLLCLSACGSPGCLRIVSLSRIIFLSSSVRASSSPSVFSLPLCCPFSACPP